MALGLGTARQLFFLVRLFRSQFGVTGETGLLLQTLLGMYGSIQALDALAASKVVMTARGGALLIVGFTVHIVVANHTFYRSVRGMIEDDGLLGAFELQGLVRHGRL